MRNALALVVAASLSGCGLVSGGGAQHCDGRTASPAVAGCTEWPEVSAAQMGFLTAGCDAQGGKLSSGLCDHTGALGGCTGTFSLVDGTTWWFPSPEVQTEADVSTKKCTTLLTFVNIQGGRDAFVTQQVLPGGKPPMCATAGGVASQIAITNTTGTAYQAWEVDTSCVEGNPRDVPRGSMVYVNTLTTHPFRIRDAATLALIREVPAGTTTVTLP